MRLGDNSPLALSPSRPLAGFPLAVGPHYAVPHSHVAAEVRRRNTRTAMNQVGRVCLSAPLGSPVGLASRWGQTRPTSGSPAPVLPCMSSAIFHISSGSCSHTAVTFPVPAVTFCISASRFPIPEVGLHAPEERYPYLGEQIPCSGRQLPYSGGQLSMFQQPNPMFRRSTPVLPQPDSI